MRISDWSSDVCSSDLMVEEDAPLADLMTDKATVEISAPVSGRILKTAGKVGDQVAIGSVLAVFDVEDVRQEGLAGELTESREQLSAIADRKSTRLNSSH